MSRKSALIAVLAVVMSAVFVAPQGVAAKTCGPFREAVQFDQAKSATLLFMPGPVRTPEPVLTADLERLRGFSVGLFSPTLGRYSPTQMMLDISQGARVASGLYKPAIVPPPPLIVHDGQGIFRDWRSLVARADDVPGDIKPGLFGCTLLDHSIPGSWIGAAGSLTSTGIAATADGLLPFVSMPPQSGLADAISRAQRQRPFVSALLPAGGYGFGIVQRLAAEQPKRMIIVVQAPPDPARTRLLTIAVRGIGGDGGIRSATTRRDGLVAATDIAPTILDRLGIKSPKTMQGQP
ncbi:MAG: hypothetical protein ACRDKI_06680, partial [Solirubrobacterales bacterium]